jgi:RNA polymerase sigma-70 factor (ECF subfamily)
MTGNNGAETCPPDNQPPDEAVLEAIAGGEVDAFEVLVRRHSRAVFGIVSRRVPAGDVEDVAQQVFVSAFRSLGDYGGRQPFEHWIARIARRRSCDYWRTQERRQRCEVLDTPDADGRNRQTERADVRMAETAYADEKRRLHAAGRVEEALLVLGEEDRVLMEHIYFEDLPLREVAAALGWSLVNVKVKAHRLRKRLHAVLTAMDKQEGKAR